MYFGFIQGRLSKPVDGKIQEFPENWEEEYAAASELGLGHIEWVITQKTSNNNPIYDMSSQPNGLKILSLCADNVVKAGIFDNGVLEQELERIIATADLLKIKYVTVPLLEQSSLKGQNMVAILKRLRTIADSNSSRLTFELDLGLQDAEEFVEDAREILGYARLVYDTGNTQTITPDHSQYIEMFHPYFSHVHLKDRITGTYTTVEPGTGGVDFAAVIPSLSLYRPDIVCMLQTARGPVGQEQRTIGKHLNFFKSFGGFFNV